VSTRTGVDGEAETKAIPARVREEVYERDGGVCRMCGSYGESLALHHVRYRSEGGLHVAANLVSVHWMYAPRCHEVAHGMKPRWQPILLYVARTPGVTALQVARWLREGSLMPADLERVVKEALVEVVAGAGSQQDVE
jgi:hypothetical protein